MREPRSPARRPSRFAEGARWLARNPLATLIGGAAVLALAFPRHVTGTLGAMVLAGAVAVAVARNWPSLPAWLRKPPDDFTRKLVVLLVVAFGVSVFWDTLTESPDWQMGDWGPQRTALAHLMPHLPGVHAPVWDPSVSTGDAPFELYPSLTYFITGHLALLFGLEDDLPLALMVVAVCVHVAISAATTAIAMRVAPKPIALALGMLSLVDSGAVAHGGTVGLFRWGLLHSTMSLAFTTLGALGVMAALKKPSRGATLAIWVGIALSVATHPAGLVAAAAMMLGCGAAALFASDVPPRRALVALFHVGVGLALTACVWMPLASRILLYGEHYPNALRSPGRLLSDMLEWATPTTAFSLFAYIGMLGIVVGLWSRRAVIVFVAGTLVALYVGMCDAPYLAFDLAPGRGVARLGVERLASIARPFLAAASAYMLATAFAHVKKTWEGASPARRTIAAAAIGILSVALFRALPEVWRTASYTASQQAREIAPDADGRNQLVAWAKQQMRSQTPESFGRAMFEEANTHEQMHLTAETGLPAFHIGPIPDMLLRERIEDASDASLLRFDVKWVIGVGQSPTGGDPTTEVVMGTYHVRSYEKWDGKFARIEKGGTGGRVRVTKLDSEAVVVEVEGTTEPALVALGTGYYPRWRATHASGIDEPVYALPTIDGGHFKVVSAWVKPGRTVFTCDGPLASDHDGLLISVGAVLFCLVLSGLWARRTWRVRVLRRVARVRARVRKAWPRARVAAVAIPFVVVALLAWGVTSWLGPAKDVGVGSGLRGIATVQARPIGGGDTWQDCSYSRIGGAYRCGDLVEVYDASAWVINDASPSWAFNTPSITADMMAPCELRIWVNARLQGTYWAGSTNGSADLTIEGEPEQQHIAYTTPLTYNHEEARTLEIEATLGTGTTWAFTMVRTDTLIPDRNYAAPPDKAPF